MTEASRAGLKRSGATRCAISERQSGIVGSDDPVYRSDKRAPGAALFAQDLSSGSGGAVIAPPALVRLLHPAAFDQSTPLQSVQQRIERGGIEAQLPARTLLDHLADLVSMAAPSFCKRKNQQLRASLL